MAGRGLGLLRKGSHSDAAASIGVQRAGKTVPTPTIAAAWSVKHHSGHDDDTYHWSKPGLGFEVARQLTAAGHQVWIGARDHARGQQGADTLGARFVQLDVTDDASVAAATETVATLDVLVNNAGISGGRIRPSDATVDQMRTVYETNVFGPVRVLRAFIPLLENSPAPVVINVSSGVGSLGLASDGDWGWAHGTSLLHDAAPRGATSLGDCCVKQERHERYVGGVSGPEARRQYAGSSARLGGSDRALCRADEAAARGWL